MYTSGGFIREIGAVVEVPLATFDAVIKKVLLMLVVETSWVVDSVGFDDIDIILSF